MIGKTIAELTPGDRAEITRVVEQDDIASFVDAVGDFNPVHSDRAYAAATPFKVPIAPGIYTAGLVSAVIGTQLPGPGAIYLSQSLKFVKPVRAGDRVTARKDHRLRRQSGRLVGEQASVRAGRKAARRSRQQRVGRGADREDDVVDRQHELRARHGNRPASA